MSVPMIVEVVAIFTPVVVTVKVAVEPPEGTVTDPGTDAEKPVLERVTIDPTGPAIPLRLTVAVDELPPRTDVGLSVTEARVAGFIVNVAVCVCPFSVAEIRAVVWVLTPPVVIVNVADF